MTLHHRRAVLMAVGATAIAALSSEPVLGQAAYPSQTIRFIIPAGAGGLPDTVARIVARRSRTRSGSRWWLRTRPAGTVPYRSRR